MVDCDSKVSKMKKGSAWFLFDRRLISIFLSTIIAGTPPVFAMDEFSYYEPHESKIVSAPKGVEDRSHISIEALDSFFKTKSEITVVEVINKSSEDV